MGKETVNASEFSTDTFISSLAVLPPPSELSLTKKEKFKSLSTDGTTSQVEEVLPETTVANSGIYLIGDDFDGKDLNIGPPELDASGGMIIATSLSICSQLYVRLSTPSTSVAIPVKTKGVDFGMLKFAPAFAIGAVLPVFVTVAQVAED